MLPLSIFNIQPLVGVRREPAIWTPNAFSIFSPGIRTNSFGDSFSTGLTTPTILRVSAFGTYRYHVFLPRDFDFHNVSPNFLKYCRSRLRNVRFNICRVRGWSCRHQRVFRRTVRAIMRRAGFEPAIDRSKRPRITTTPSARGKRL